MQCLAEAGFVLFALLLAEVKAVDLKVEAPEANLVTTLLEAYPPNLTVGGVPALEAPTIIPITAVFSIQDVPDIDDIHGVLNVNAILQLNWTDPFLQWPGMLDPVILGISNADLEQWKGIETVAINSPYVWTPDILHDDNSKDVHVIAQVGSRSPVLVTGKTGTVEYQVMTVFNSRCQLDLERFPFDRQKCSLHFRFPQSASFAEGSTVIVPEKKKADVSDETSLWKLVSYDSEVSDDETIFTVTLKMQRRPNYYTWNTIIPLACAASLQLTVFLLPPEDSIRALHAVSCLLAYGFFLVSVNKQIPKTSQTIYMNLYASSMLALHACAAFFAAVMLFIATPKDGYGRSVVKMNPDKYHTVRRINLIAFLAIFILTVGLHAVFYYLILGM